MHKTYSTINRKEDEMMDYILCTMYNIKMLVECIFKRREIHDKL